MVSANEELNDYVLKGGGISRTALSIIAFVGVFIFGWLIAVVFQLLGKGSKGWAYVIPILILFFISRSSGDPTLSLLVLFIYIAAWVHANVILSRVQSAARARLAEIDRQGTTEIDSVLVKGILLHKALQQKQLAADALATALQMPGGDPVLLNMAGVVMTANKRYNETVSFFDRAGANAKDEKLLKQIKINRTSAGKMAGK